jgi:hypothetical protein
MIVLGQAMVLLALRGPRPGWRGTAELGLFGLVVGLGLWTDPLVMTYLVAAVLALWLQGRLAWPPRPARLAAGLGGALLGLGPLLWPTPRLFLDQVVALAGHSALKGAGQPVSVGTWVALQLARPISTALITGPVVVGGWLGGVRGSNSSPAEFWRVVAQHPLLYAVALNFAFLAGAGVVGGGLHALRGARRRRAARQSVPSHMQAGLALATVALVGSVVFMAHYGDLWATPRYFLPVVSALPLSVAWWARVGPRLGRRLAHHGATALAGARQMHPRQDMAIARAHRLLVPAAGLALLLWNALALAALTPIGTAPLDHHQPVIGDDRAAIAALLTHGVRCARVDGYWMTYRLGFDSQERVIPIAVRGDALDPMNRYPPYLRDPACVAHVGYVEMVGSAADTTRAAEWSAGALPGYVRLAAGQFVVYVPAA